MALGVQPTANTLRLELIMTAKTGESTARHTDTPREKFKAPAMNAHRQALKGNSGELLVDESGQLGLAHGAHFSGGELAIFEHHQGRDASDAEFGRDVAVFIDIHLGNLQLALVAGGNFVQNRGNHFARTAPLGPEIDHNWLACL